MRYSEMDIAALSKLLQNKEVTAKELAADALKAIAEKDDTNVLIHDGARPFVSQRILNDVCKALETHKAVTVAVACTDTIYNTAGEEDLSLCDIPPRHTLYRAQTPQAFRLTLIKQAFEKLTEQELMQTTDDAGVLHKAMPDVKILILKGEETNRKITFKEDLT